MVLRNWIVPEPDPKLRLEVFDINIYTLNYEDIRYICSCTMKKYYHEFKILPGFINYANKLIEEHNNLRINYKSPPPIKRTIIKNSVKTPPKINTPVFISKLKPVKAGKRNYDKTLEQYDKYIVNIKKKDTSDNSEMCIIS